MKTLDWYQDEARRTAASTPSIAVLALGVTGEAGEVADLVKKHLGHGKDLDRMKVAKELGDVLWYVAALADLIGFSLEAVAVMNVEKLKDRHPNGFQPNYESDSTPKRGDAIPEGFKP